MWTKLTDETVREGVLYKQENDKELFERFMKEILYRIEMFLMESLLCGFLSLVMKGNIMIILKTQ